MIYSYKIYNQRFISIYFKCLVYRKKSHRLKKERKKSGSYKFRKSKTKKNYNILGDIKLDGFQFYDLLMSSVLTKKAKKL